MRRLTVCLILSFLILGPVLPLKRVYAQETQPGAQQTPPETVAKRVPVGMEAIRIGDSGWVIIPKGAKTRKVGAQIIVEGTREYMSRRFYEMDQRLTKIEQKQAEIENELKKLTATTPKPVQQSTKKNTPTENSPAVVYIK